LFQKYVCFKSTSFPLLFFLIRTWFLNCIWWLSCFQIDTKVLEIIFWYALDIRTCDNHDAKFWLSFLTSKGRHKTKTVYSETPIYPASTGKFCTVPPPWSISSVFTTQIIGKTIGKQISWWNWQKNETKCKNG